MASEFYEFTRGELSFEGETRPVFRKGQGPAVILLHEVPGLHPGVFRLADVLCEAGLTVFLPSLFGEPGRPFTAGYVATSMVRACVMREFAVFSRSKTSPVTSWLACLARHAHRECGGEGVGVIGMCITGGFALALMIEPSVIAPVLCNPSLPFALTPSRKRDLGVDAETLERAKARSEAGKICVLGLRFSGDIAVPHERFQRLREEFGENFQAIEIDSRPGNSHGIRVFAHSVLGADHVERPGHPTLDAERRTIAFLCERLIGHSGLEQKELPRASRCADVLSQMNNEIPREEVSCSSNESES
ncbi:MAG: dienelactone hydrolase family protein [Myxococcota bacterium]